MKARVGNWGGSCAIRIPQIASQNLGLEVGELVALEYKDGGLFIKSHQPHYELSELVAQAQNLTAPDPIDTPAMGLEEI